MSMPPWAGQAGCGGRDDNGRPCPEPEIEGLGCCFRHVPADLLDEAEMVTGLRQCYRKDCTNPAIPGSRSCGSHSRASQVIEGRVMSQLEQLMARSGADLLKPPPIGDPYAELMDVAAEIKALKEKLKYLVTTMDTATWRYATSRAGEMIRAEIILYERALDRYATILLNIAKLDIESRLAAIRSKQAEIMERALDMALAEGGALELADQARVRHAFVRHLKVVAS